MLKCLVNNIDLINPSDVAVLACALTAFWGLFRLGELLPTTATSPNGTFPTWSNVSDLPKESVLIHLPWSKTTRWAGADVILAPQLAPLDPISALHFHRKYNKVATNEKLFTF